MSKIQTFLENILSARYGKDVRQSIHDAIQEIDSVADTAQTSATAQAEAARKSAQTAALNAQEAEKFKNEAAAIVPSGYSDLVEQVNENTIKIDTIIEKADLGIKNTASGEEIHVTDSANAKVREFALYGKAKQNTTSGKNKLNLETSSQGLLNHDNGLLASSNTMWLTSDFIEVNNQNISIYSNNASDNFTVRLCEYNSLREFIKCTVNTTGVFGNETKSLVLDSSTKYIRISYGFNNKATTKESYIASGNVIQVEEGTVSTKYEPYTGGQPSPNPKYPQDIEVSGESYNLLENTATSKTENGGIFTVNADKSVTVNGTISAPTNLYVSESLTLEAGYYVFSGGHGDKTLENGYFMYIEDVGVFSDDNFKNTMFTLTEEKTLKVRITARTGAVLNNVTFYPMIRRASVKNDKYMPYGKGSVEVKSWDENLVIQRNSTWTINGVTFVQNENIIDVDGTTPSNSFGFSEPIINSVLPKGNYIMMVDCDNPNDKEKIYLSLRTSLSVSSEFKRVYLKDNGYEHISDGSTLLYMLLQVKEGQTVNSRVKVIVCQKTSSATIPTPNGLVGVNNVCDEIIKYADGSGERVQRFYAEEVTKIHTLDSTNLLGQLVIHKLPKSYMESEKANERILCNVGVSKSLIDLRKSNYGIAQYGSSLYFRNGDIEQSKASYDAWLTENPVRVIYELAEPIITPLSQDEISGIEKLSTFYPVTNISNDADCGMSVTYLADSKLYIDQRLAQIEAALVNNI